MRKHMVFIRIHAVAIGDGFGEFLVATITILLL
jgi:hypothetical protein